MLRVRNSDVSLCQCSRFKSLTQHFRDDHDEHDDRDNALSSSSDSLFATTLRCGKQFTTLEHRLRFSLSAADWKSAADGWHSYIQCISVVMWTKSHAFVNNQNVIDLVVLTWSKRTVLTRVIDFVVLTWMVGLVVLAQVIGFVVYVNLLVIYAHVASTVEPSTPNLRCQDCRLWSKVVKNQRVYPADFIKIGGVLTIMIDSLRC